MDNRYEAIVYSNEDRTILDSTILSKDEMNEIKNNKLKLKNKNYLCVIEDLYKFHKNNYSTSDISEIFKVSTRQIQKIFKELGINRNLFEAQQIIAEKKDYEKSKRTYKKNLLEKLVSNDEFDTVFEQYLRHQLDMKLNTILPECEIIIGINSVNIITSENEIPIIIINKNSLYKYIIDINNNFKENSDSGKKRDKPKISKAYYKGYTLFQFSNKASYNSKENILQYKKEIEKKLSEIIEIITSEVLGNLSPVKLE